MYVDLSLFVLLYNTNFMKNLKFNYLFFSPKTKNNLLTVHIFYNLLNHPTFYSEERLVK